MCTNNGVECARRVQMCTNDVATPARRVQLCTFDAVICEQGIPSIIEFLGSSGADPCLLGNVYVIFHDVLGLCEWVFVGGAKLPGAMADGKVCKMR
jgi:hypothetical protein